MKHEITISRKLKHSPNSKVKDVILEVICKNRDGVIDLPAVQKAVNSVCGKNIIVTVTTVEPFLGSSLVYEIEKTRTRVRAQL